MISWAIGFAANLDAPNDKLPSAIKPKPGQITLYADYSSRASNGSIPVYLINSGTTNLNLAAQDGDVCLKLETTDTKGHWVRAQPHVFSWCGNSYLDSPQVRPGHFLRIEGYQPTNGQPRKVRFSLHGQEFALSSNAGNGLASARDIDLASRDAMAVEEGSFDFVSSLALGKLRLTNEMDHLTDLQQLAIRRLGSSKFDSRKCRRVLSEVAEKFPELEGDVASVIRELDWKAKSDRAAQK